jgi:hypothetical protein
LAAERSFTAATGNLFPSLTSFLHRTERAKIFQGALSHGFMRQSGKMLGVAKQLLLLVAEADMKAHQFWIEIVALGTAIACGLALLLATLGAAAATVAGQVESGQAASASSRPQVVRGR